MGKATPDDVLDVFLDEIAEADTLYICSAEPADFAGIASVALADVSLTPGDGNGDFTIADDTSGRKLTIAAQNGITVDTSGDATHRVLADVANEKLKQVTTCTSQTLTAGNTANVPAHKVSIADPT